MCKGWFPSPVLLQREFSNPNYLPNQAPPSADPVWKYENTPVPIAPYNVLRGGVDLPSP